MPCKIEIKSRITNIIEVKTLPGLSMSIDRANSLADDVNKEFGAKVVSFDQEGDFINRDINVPSTLVDEYFDNELKKEEAEDRGRREEGNWDINDEGDIVPFYQKEEMPASKASSATIAKVKEVLKKMGVNIQALSDYLKGNPNVKAKGANALTDLVQGIIAVAQGKEEVALTEEMVHVATAMLEQTNPQLITHIISKIDRFRIYKQVLDAYKNDKNYQLSNGKPDIRKIKKEAADKLIAEVIIRNAEGVTEFPELLQEENRSLIRQLWDMVMDAIRGMYRKSNIDIFEEVAEKIVTEEPEEFQPIEGEGIYLQKEAAPLVDKLYNKVMEMAGRMQLFPETSSDKRHYTLDGKRVAKSVTEKIKQAARHIFGERTPLQKIDDDVKQAWGNAVHNFLEKYITSNLIDKDGYRRTAFLEGKIESELPDAIREKLENFAKELISSYTEGTRFIVETMIVNEKYKGLLASTVDFMAIEPVTNKKGEPDIKVDVLDWKSLAINKQLGKDVPWFKQREWKEQMGHYSRIIQNYGAKYDQMRKTRMMPFVLNYEYKVPGDKKSGLVPTSMEIGKLNNAEETHLYLLPVALNTETTGNKRVDALVGSLMSHWEKLYSKPVSPQEKFSKIQTLNQLSAAIRHLHIALNFEPLLNVGETFLKNAARTIKSFKDIDYSKTSQEELEKHLADIISYRESAQKFMEIDDVFLSQYPKEGLEENDLKMLKRFSEIAKSTKRMLDQIDDIQTEYVVQLALKKGVVLETMETEKGVRIKAETVVNSLLRTFEQASHLAPKLITLATNLITNSINIVNDTYRRGMKEFEKIILPLEDEARAKGVKALSLIGSITPEGIHLFKKLDKEFWTSLSKAKEESNKKYLMENIDMDKFRKLSKEVIDKQIEDLNHTQFSQDKSEDKKMREAAIIKLKNSIDIERENFNGYDGFAFGYVYNQCIIEEGHYSKEYQGMSENAKKVWEFFVGLNQKAKKLGYLEKQGTSFFPLIEATTLQKFYQSKNTGKQLKEFFTDMYSIKPNEENAYAMFDPETGKPKKQIPKYFTRTDKEVDQLSTDLVRVGSLWMKSILEYEAAKGLESTLQVMLDVEKKKGSLVTDPNGNVVFTGDLPRVNYSENKNAEILQAMVDDYLYNIQQDVNSIGNVQISKVTEKFSKTEEGKEKAEVSIKKVMKMADTQIRVLGVGLKPLIGLANWAGYQMQAFIQAGNFYKFREFEVNNAKISAGVNISMVERALLDMIIPFNEDVAEQLHRKLARKQGLISYLGTWKFVDVMMSTNRFPERRLQYANALSFIDNSMVVDGKIVNIRQYVKRQDAKNKYNTSFAERRALEKTYEKRVAELKQKSSLAKVAKIENDELIIEGVTPEAIAEFRTKIVTYGGTLNGQMTEGDKAGYRRDTIITSFMMFKTWIPGLVSARTAGLHKNIQTDEWTYGRTRVFVKVWSELGLLKIHRMREIIQGSEEGIRILNEMLEAKRAEHFRKTGQELDITEEEFYDLVRQELSREMRELFVLFSMLGMVVAAKAAQPPDDTSELEKNRYKWWAKAINKMTDEIRFYFDPTSLDGITRGSIMPSIGLLSKAGQFITHLSRETEGYIIDDEDMMNKAHPTKYFLNLIPMGAQFQNEVIPYLSPDLAKELGIRVSAQSRGMTGGNR